MDKKMTKEYQAAWDRLKRRFPGMEGQLESMVLTMACNNGPAKSRVRLETRPGGVAAFVEVFTILYEGGRKALAYPVIPDEHNPHPEKLVTPGMTPHVFASQEECQAAAEQAEKILLVEVIKEEEKLAKRGTR